MQWHLHSVGRCCRVGVVTAVQPCAGKASDSTAGNSFQAAQLPIAQLVHS